MTYLEVLEKWAAYSNYDSEQKCFNLLSKNYVFHNIGKVIEMLLAEYDSSGMLGVIYAKIQFEKLLKTEKLTIWDAMTNPDMYKEEMEMYKVFNEPVVRDAEDEFIKKINQIYSKITQQKLIGEDSEQRKQLLESMEKVAESINKCNVDLFKKGGKINDTHNVSTKIHLFNTMAECLLEIEKALDGIYFCFIKANGSADCFFTFLLKSNGNIISVNDRIDEGYIGEHGTSRNGRWTEGKVDKIFPYDYIFNYSEHDYKGYASKYEIIEEKLELHNLGIEVFMPIVMSMLLLILKYKGKEVNMPIHYIDSFLPQNQLKIEKHGLMVLGESSIVCKHNNINIDFDNQKIISGEYAEEFHWNYETNNNSKETGSFTNKNKLMVELWSEGFIFDTTALFKSNNILCLQDKENDRYIPEFIGSEKRLRLQVYKEARTQLAEYMKDKIYKAWVDYGKTEAVKEWYKKALLNNCQNIYNMLMDYEEGIETGEISPLYTGWKRGDDELNIYIIRNDDYPTGHYLSRDAIIGCTEVERWKWVCDISGCACNMWFVIAPQTWEQLEFLTNQSVPKIVKGWKQEGHSCTGNSLLYATDEVETVGTPFEYKYTYKEAYYDFKVAFGFSKRGWNKLKKDRNKLGK